MAYEPELPKHVCMPPTIQQGYGMPIKPEWKCGECGRVFRDTGTTIRRWVEFTGPIHIPKGQRL